MPPSRRQARPPSILRSRPPARSSPPMCCVAAWITAIAATIQPIEAIGKGRVGLVAWTRCDSPTGMTAAPPLIAFAHVGKSFDGGRGAERVLAVDDVSLDVAAGEFLAIVGGSGSGKTTLLRLANRLIDADAGTITIEGEDVRAADPVRLRRRIGYVFQSGALFPHLTVAGNIGITPKLLGTPQAEIADRVDELLELVRLDRAQHRDRLPQELSGGQRQRVGVARALAARPDRKSTRLNSSHVESSY